MLGAAPDYKPSGKLGFCDFGSAPGTSSYVYCVPQCSTGITQYPRKEIDRFRAIVAKVEATRLAARLIFNREPANDPKGVRVLKYLNDRSEEAIRRGGGECEHVPDCAGQLAVSDLVELPRFVLQASLRLESSR